MRLYTSDKRIHNGRCGRAVRVAQPCQREGGRQWSVRQRCGATEEQECKAAGQEEGAARDGELKLPHSIRAFSYTNLFTRIQSATPAPSEPETDSGKASQAGPPPLSTIDFTEDEDDEAYKQFADVFAKFQQPEASTSAEGAEGPNKGEVIYSDDDMMSESDEDEEKKREKIKLSKRKQRQLRRLTVAELKQMVKKPEVVEWEDVTAMDPRILIQLKSTRNTVPIPPHWSLKRDYLQNKKGIEKPPFQLPCE